MICKICGRDNVEGLKVCADCSKALDESGFRTEDVQEAAVSFADNENTVTEVVNAECRSPLLVTVAILTLILSVIILSVACVAEDGIIMLFKGQCSIFECLVNSGIIDFFVCAVSAILILSIIKSAATDSITPKKLNALFITVLAGGLCTVASSVAASIYALYYDSGTITYLLAKLSGRTGDIMSLYFVGAMLTALLQIVLIILISLAIRAVSKKLAGNRYADIKLFSVIALWVFFGLHVATLILTITYLSSLYGTLSVITMSLYSTVSAAILLCAGVYVSGFSRSLYCADEDIKQ